jgi:hypothetical protein
MSLATFTVPSSGQPCYVRAEDVSMLSAPFKWGDGTLARTLALSNGQTVMVEDTDDNIAAAITAIGSADDATAVLTQTPGTVAP